MTCCRSARFDFTCVSLEIPLEGVSQLKEQCIIPWSRFHNFLLVESGERVEADWGQEIAPKVEE